MQENDVLHAPFLNELFAEFEEFPYGEYDDQVDTATPQGPRDVVLECWQTIWSVGVLSTLTGEGFKIIRSFGRDRRRALELFPHKFRARWTSGFVFLQYVFRGSPRNPPSCNRWAFFRLP